MTLLSDPTRFLFFTGKGGVGKTSLSAAVAVELADAGKQVLLVSTDAASNLDDILGIALSNAPVPVPGVPRFAVLHIDPDVAAENYRLRVLANMAPASLEGERATVREQLSGACTTEIASFDEFSDLLAGGGAGYDHVIFDTAPTGHTLRLLSLPKAWTGFLKDNDRGASCLGPHSGLKMQETRFNAALEALCDPAATTVILVARPESGALAEAARTSSELRALGLHNQRLVVNGLFTASDPQDAVARAVETLGREALQAMPDAIRSLPQSSVPLRAFDMVGLPALRALLNDEQRIPRPGRPPVDSAQLRAGHLQELVDRLSANGRGLIMVMGKGGVGKTTIAAALAIGLVRQGHAVHLSTTDPANHLGITLAGALPGLDVGHIDPKLETERYVDGIMASRSPGLDEQGRALLLEDLRSPCTEEVAVFRAFSRTVSKARSAFVVLDTAPTGHSLLLMDATGAYHRQMMGEFEGQPALHAVTPLMRLQDPLYTQIVLVTLAEVTPVSQAAALQDDLRRAGVEPYAWVVNRSLLAAGTRDPLLAARLEGERQQLARLAGGLARQAFIVPWMPLAPVGVPALSALLAT